MDELSSGMYGECFPSSISHFKSFSELTTCRTPWLPFISAINKKENYITFSKGSVNQKIKSNSLNFSLSFCLIFQIF